MDNSPESGKVVIMTKKDKILKQCQAFTFIELSFIMIVCSVALVGIIIGFHSAVRNLEWRIKTRACALIAEDLLLEIRSKKFSGTLTIGENRRNYDDIGDYHGLSESPPKTIEGQAMANFVGFTRNVIVTNVWTNLVTEVPTNTDIKLIKVITSCTGIRLTNLTVMTRQDDW